MAGLPRQLYRLPCGVVRALASWSASIEDAQSQGPYLPRSRESFCGDRTCWRPPRPVENWNVPSIRGEMKWALPIFSDRM